MIQLNYHMLVECSTKRKMPRFRRTGAWILDIEIYLDVLELMHAAMSREGVKILFSILSCHSKGSELLVNAQFLHSLIAAGAAAHN